jgi:hypothetical protein
MGNRIRVPQKTKIKTTIKTSNTTSRNTPEEMLVSYSRSTCTSMFIAALFTIAIYNTIYGNSQDSQTTDKWNKKMSYLYTKEFYSSIKNNERIMKLLFLSFAGKWMALENIILSKVSQVQKTKVCIFFLLCGI